MAMPHASKHLSSARGGIQISSFGFVDELEARPTAFDGTGLAVGIAGGMGPRVLLPFVKSPILAEVTRRK
jgi:hypothetical protein